MPVDDAWWPLEFDRHSLAECGRRPGRCALVVRRAAGYHVAYYSVRGLDGSAHFDNVLDVRVALINWIIHSRR